MSTKFGNIFVLTPSRPEVFLCEVKSSGIIQSKIIEGLAKLKEIKSHFFR